MTPGLKACVLAGVVLLLAGCIDTVPEHASDEPFSWSGAVAGEPADPMRVFEDSIALSVHVVARAALAVTPSGGNCVNVEGSPVFLNGLFRVEWNSPIDQEARLAIVYEMDEGAFLAATVTGSSPLSLSLAGLAKPSELAGTAESERTNGLAFIVTTVDPDDILIADARLDLKAVYGSKAAIPAFSPNSIHNCSGLPG